MAYSPIEDKFLSALAAVQFPDAPVEQPQQDMQLAAGPSQTVSDAGNGYGSIKPIEQTTFEKALQSAGIGLEQAGRFLDSLGQVDVPLLGKVSLADFVPFVGSAKDGTRSVMGPAEWQGTPMALQQAGTGQSLTRGTGFARQLKPDAQLALIDAATNAVPVAKGVAGAAKALAPKAGEMVVEGMQKLGTPVQMFAVPPGPNVVSTRLPTAVKATEDPIANKLTIGLDSAKADPKAFEHNMALVQQYPNFSSKARNPDRRAEDFITEVKNNLLHLYDQVPEATRQRSKLWYDGARNIVDRWGNEFNVPDQAASGVLAVLSPQKDWFMNVSLGNRVLDIAQTKGNHAWDDAMERKASQIWSDPKYAPVLDLVRGKRYEDLQTPAEKALWLRTYDQAFNSPSHQIVSPEGNFDGVRLNQNGSESRVAWGSLNEIGKAISILDNPTLENISSNLGQQHKVRNFYNNIYAPNDPAGHVTIDTHAVAAGLLRPLSGNSREVLHNFGSGVVGERGPANSSLTGVQGTYGLYAEAYRRAAQERGVLPREMQSITWEAVRGLFPDTFKANAKNVKEIDDIWLKYRKGQLSLDEARNEVFRAAGGIEPPEWERAGLRRATAGQGGPAADAGELPGSGVSGRGATGSGRVQPAPGNSSSVKRGRQALQPGAE